MSRSARTDPANVPPGLPDQLPELRNAVRRLLGLDDDTAVVIRRLGSTELGRSAATIISVRAMEGESRRWALPEPAGTITEDLLRAALAQRHT